MKGIPVISRLFMCVNSGSRPGPCFAYSSYLYGRSLAGISEIAPSVTTLIFPGSIGMSGF